MTLRDDLIPVVDEIRGIHDELGLRVRSAVIVRSTTVSGTGLASATSTSDRTLSPTPRVRLVTGRNPQPDGLYRAGNIIVDQISASYTRTQLDPGGASVWIIDGKQHRLLSLEQRAFRWRAVLEPLTR